MKDIAYECGIRLQNKPGEQMNKLNVMFVYAGEELWGAEQLRIQLAEAGIRLMPEETFTGKAVSEAGIPALVLVQLTGRQEVDQEVCRKMVKARIAPVIAISSASEEGYVLSILDTGVDDFILRPVKTRELSARIRAILRRARPDLLPGLAPDSRQEMPRRAQPAPPNGPGQTPAQLPKNNLYHQARKLYHRASTHIQRLLCIGHRGKTPCTAGPSGCDK